MSKDSRYTPLPPDGRVLLVVDAQKGFVTPSSRHIVEPLENLQYDFDKVIFTRFENPDESPFRRILKYCRLAPDSDETRLAIDPRPDAIVLKRSLYTCVTRELRGLLHQWRAEEIHVAGIATEACVLKTVLDLFEHNIRPWVVADLCASDKERRFHDMALELIAALVGPEHLVNSQALAGEMAA